MGIFYACIYIYVHVIERNWFFAIFTFTKQLFSILLLSFFFFWLNIVWITILFSMHVYILSIEIKKQIDFLEFIKATYLLI